MDHTDLIARLEAEYHRFENSGDASHDIFHARRVKSTALAIAREESAGNSPVSSRVLIAGAYLHDLVNLPKDAPNRAQASLLSAQAARPILQRIGFNEDEIARTSHVIIAHSFSANIAPQTLEARILQDADRLEALGAIGLARLFYIAGSLGRNLFDGEDPFALARPLDDKSFALDHFATKLLHLPARMQTASGRAMAEQRCLILQDFLTALRAELAPD